MTRWLVHTAPYQAVLVQSKPACLSVAFFLGQLTIKFVSYCFTLYGYKYCNMVTLSDAGGNPTMN